MCPYTSICGSLFEILKRQVFRNGWSRIHFVYICVLEQFCHGFSNFHSEKQDSFCPSELSFNVCALMLSPDCSQSTWMVPLPLTTVIANPKNYDARFQCIVENIELGSLGQLNVEECLGNLRSNLLILISILFRNHQPARFF